MEESFGQALGRLRREGDPKLSLRALGRLVHYTGTYLWQIEHGQKPVTRELAARCDAAFGAGGELVALAEEESTEVIALAMRAGSDRTQVETRDIDALRTARDRYERLYCEIGGVALRPRLLEYVRNHATPLVKNGMYDTATGSTLYRAVGSLVALTGVCAYDADEQAAAERHYQQALKLARASGDRIFVGYVVSLLATQAVRTKRPKDAIAYADSTLASPGGLTPALLTDLHCIRAEAYAQFGEITVSARHMDAAYQSSTQIDLNGEPSETRHIQPGVLEGRHAEVLRVLGEFSKADDHARRSVELGHSSHPRARANKMVVLTNVLTSGGELDEAATTGMRLVDLAHDMESRLLRQRMRDLRTVLLPHRNSTPGVANFCDRTDDLLQMPL